MDIKGCAVVKVVVAEQLEDATRSGWKFLEVLTETTPTTVGETVNVPVAPGHSPSHGAYASSPGHVVSCTNTRALVVQRLSFLVGQDEESVIAKMNTEIVQLKTSLLNEQKSVAHQKKDNENLAEIAAGYQRRLKDEEANATRLRERNFSVETQNKKLEESIAKIRKAIGERQMNDILAQ